MVQLIHVSVHSSASCVSWQCGTAHIYCCVPCCGWCWVLGWQPWAIDRHLLAGPTAANPQQQHLVGKRDRHRQIEALHRPCSTSMLAVPKSLWDPLMVGQSVTRMHARTNMNTHTHTRLTALCLGLPGWAGTRKVKPIWILLKQETVSGSGISWAICKSAPRSREPRQHPTTQPQLFTGRMPFLPSNQQRQSTEGSKLSDINYTKPRREMFHMLTRSQRRQSETYISCL